MPVTLAYNFPPFDTGLYEGTEFILSKGHARLIVNVAEHPRVILDFQRVRWHEFTALYHCSVDQISSAFFKLVIIDSSARLADYVAADELSQNTYTSLFHFRMYLDEHGCHELFAQSFRADPENCQWPAPG